MIFELKFEDIVLVNFISWTGSVDTVTKEGKTGEGEVVLEGFVEVETEVGEDYPEFLPSV